jgi:hypothetical protein
MIRLSRHDLSPGAVPELEVTGLSILSGWSWTSLLSLCGLLLLLSDFCKFCALPGFVPLSVLVFLPFAIAFHSVLSKAHFPFLSFLYPAFVAAGRIVLIVGARTILFVDRVTADLEVLL